MSPLYKLSSVQVLPFPVVKSCVYNLSPSIPTCCVCLEPSHLIHYMTIDFEVGLREEANYGVCSDCLAKTLVRHHEIDVMDPVELPLYISDANVFVRHRATQILNGSYPSKFK